MTMSREPASGPPVGPHGQPCDTCGSPLAGDQRYCLACGERRAGLRTDFTRRHIAPASVPDATEVVTESVVRTAAPARGPRPWHFDSGLAAGAACLLLALLVGYLMGMRLGDDAPAQVVAAAPSAATAAVPATGVAAPVSFVSDWPAGKRGWTVQLQVLPPESTPADVAAAKQQAVTSGAAGAGALDAASHDTLDVEGFVLFAGQYATKKEATSALDGLKTSFPDAQVVEVASAGSSTQASASASAKDDKPARDKAAKAKPAVEATPSAAEQRKGGEALQDLEAASSPEEYQKKAAKLPDTVAKPGAPPPKDDKPAGGGTEAETFE